MDAGRGPCPFQETKGSPRHGPWTDIRSCIPARQQLQGAKAREQDGLKTGPPLSVGCRFKDRIMTGFAFSSLSSLGEGRGMCISEDGFLCDEGDRVR